MLVIGVTFNNNSREVRHVDRVIAGSPVICGVSVTSNNCIKSL